MKFRAVLKRNKKLAVVAGLALFATPAFALFGFGDIVFDPSTFGEVVADVTQAIQVATNTKQTLSTIKANIAHFSLKSMWQTFSTSVMSASVHNSNGETAGWSTALNSNSPGAASTAWNMANV